MKTSVPKGGRMKRPVVVWQNEKNQTTKTKTKQKPKKKQNKQTNRKKQTKKGKEKKKRTKGWVRRAYLTKVVHMESHMVNLDTPSGLMAWGSAIVCLLAFSSAVHALCHRKMPHRHAASDQCHILISSCSQYSHFLLSHWSVNNCGLFCKKHNKSSIFRTSKSKFAVIMDYMF